MTIYHSKPQIFVSQIHLKVEELKRSLDFYQNLLGFQILRQSTNEVELTVDGMTTLLTIEQLKTVAGKEKKTTGLYHFALLLPTRQDLGKLLRYLIQSNYPLQGASNHGFSEALYFADPDGNGIEVYADTDPKFWMDQTGRLDFSKNGPMDVESVIAEAKGEVWGGFPSKTVIGHLHLHVNNLEKTKRFYRDGLGFDITIDILNQAVFFSTGGYHHHIGTNTWNGENAKAPLANNIGMLFYSLMLPDEKTRETLIGNLNSMGYSVVENHGEYYTEDPAGNRINLIY